MSKKIFNNQITHGVRDINYLKSAMEYFFKYGEQNQFEIKQAKTDNGKIKKGYWALFIEGTYRRSDTQSKRTLCNYPAK